MVRAHLEDAAGLWVIAVDGPGGSGKSTVGRHVSDALGLAHLDTGSYYRAATLAALRADASPDDPQLAEMIAPVSFEFVDGRMLMNGVDVEVEIRGPEVTKVVSAVSANADVRQLMVKRQRRWVVDQGGRAVVEGRDIGTVVFPDARLKVYLTARPEIRARRRALERPELAEEIVADLERRDRHDSTREASPLQASDDAVEIDTSDLSVDEVVQQIVRLARERGF